MKLKLLPMRFTIFLEDFKKLSLKLATVNSPAPPGTKDRPGCCWAGWEAWAAEKQTLEFQLMHLSELQGCILKTSANKEATAATHILASWCIYMANSALHFVFSHSCTPKHRSASSMSVNSCKTLMIYCLARMGLCNLTSGRWFSWRYRCPSSSFIENSRSLHELSCRNDLQTRKIVIRQSSAILMTWPIDDGEGGAVHNLQKHLIGKGTHLQALAVWQVNVTWWALLTWSLCFVDAMAHTNILHNSRTSLQMIGCYWFVGCQKDSAQDCELWPGWPRQGKIGRVDVSHCCNL